jgi:hypothetical protein
MKKKPFQSQRFRNVKKGIFIIINTSKDPEIDNVIDEDDFKLKSRLI